MPWHRKEKLTESSKSEVPIMGDGTETAAFASFRVMCLDEDQLSSGTVGSFQEEAAVTSSKMNSAFDTAEFSGFLCYFHPSLDFRHMMQMTMKLWRSSMLCCRRRKSRNNGPAEGFGLGRKSAVETGTGM